MSSKRFFVHKLCVAFFKECEEMVMFVCRVAGTWGVVVCKGRGRGGDRPRRASRLACRGWGFWHIRRRKGWPRWCPPTTDDRRPSTHARPPLTNEQTTQPPPSNPSLRSLRHGESRIYINVPM